MKYLGQLKLPRTSPQGVSQTKKFWATRGRMVEKAISLKATFPLSCTSFLISVNKDTLNTC